MSEDWELFRCVVSSSCSKNSCNILSKENNSALEQTPFVKGWSCHLFLLFSQGYHCFPFLLYNQLSKSHYEPATDKLDHDLCKNWKEMTCRTLSGRLEFLSWTFSFLMSLVFSFFTTFRSLNFLLGICGWVVAWI